MLIVYYVTILHSSQSFFLLILTFGTYRWILKQEGLGKVHEVPRFSTAPGLLRPGVPVEDRVWRTHAQVSLVPADVRGPDRVLTRPSFRNHYGHLAEEEFVARCGVEERRPVREQILWHCNVACDCSYS